jgi:hypothetical protein
MSYQECCALFPRLLLEQRLSFPPPMALFFPSPCPAAERELGRAKRLKSRTYQGRSGLIRRLPAVRCCPFRGKPNSRFSKLPECSNCAAALRAEAAYPKLHAHSEKLLHAIYCFKHRGTAGAPPLSTSARVIASSASSFRKTTGCDKGLPARPCKALHSHCVAARSRLAAQDVPGQRDPPRPVYDEAQGDLAPGRGDPVAKGLEPPARPYVGRL